MRCSEVVQNLDKYLENELTDIESFNIKKHLSNCIKCRLEYEDMKNIFSTLYSHDIVISPVNFTDNIISEVCVYQERKNIKETILFKWITSIVAAGTIATVFNINEYKPIGLFSQMYRSSLEINKIVLSPIDMISEKMKDVAGLF